MLPTDYHPSFTPERLVAVARLIERGRDAAVERYNEAIGCDSWTVGCEAFAFSKFEIQKASAELDWLEITDPSMQFTFSIGGIPVRFYRGVPDEPTKRTLKQSYSELRQLDLFMGRSEGISSRVAYRIAVEADVDGSLLAITFVVLDGETPVYSWAIPLDNIGMKPVVVQPERKEGVLIPAPKVTLVGEQDRKRSGTSG